MAEGRERSTEEATRPQAGIEDSVIWLDFYLTGWFEFIEMARRAGRNRALLGGGFRRALILFLVRGIGRSPPAPSY